MSARLVCGSVKKASQSMKKTQSGLSTDKKACEGEPFQATKKYDNVPPVTENLK